MITGVDGPSYRPLGATMAILGDGALVGSLSSGCIEADMAVHAARCLKSGVPTRLVYGSGSPFVDIKLPCGGGLEIALIPNPDQATLHKLVARHDARKIAVLDVDLSSGRLGLHDQGATRRQGDAMTVRIEPETFFYLFGKGPEAISIAALVQAAGYPNLLLSPDTQTLSAAQNAGCQTRHLTSAVFPEDLCPDRFSAVVLFFHDHEWEPPILCRAVASQAFFVGAQGSRSAAIDRMVKLSELGVTGSDLAKVAGPIGLIPSVRDARTLAVSVLAEVLQRRITG